MTLHVGQSNEAAERLAGMIRERRSRAPQPISLEPASAYEAITRQMVEDLAREMSGLRSRLDSIFYVIVGSIAVDVLVRLVG